MNRSPAAWRTGFRVVLLTLLLAMQAGVQAHELDHALGAHTGFCAVYSVGGGLQHAVVGHAPTITVTTSPLVRSRPIVRSVTASTLETASARGPPRAH